MAESKPYLRLVDVDHIPELESYKKYKPTFFERVEQIWYNIQLNFKWFIDGIKNLWYYLPVIWSDRHWEFENFLLDYIKHKATRDYKLFYKYGVSADNAQIVQDLQELIGKIDVYANYFDVFESNNQELIYNIKEAEDEMIKDELIRQYMIKLEMFKQRSRQDIYNFLKDRGEEWWD